MLRCVKCLKAQLIPARYSSRLLACRLLSATRSVTENSTQPLQPKKKWSKSNIETLASWKHETSLIYGPPVKVKKSSSTTTVKKSAKQSQVTISAGDGNGTRLVGDEPQINSTSNVKPTKPARTKVDKKVKKLEVCVADSAENNNSAPDSINNVADDCSTKGSSVDTVNNCFDGAMNNIADEHQFWSEFSSNRSAKSNSSWTSKNIKLPVTELRSAVEFDDTAASAFTNIDIGESLHSSRGGHNSSDAALHEFILKSKPSVPASTTSGNVWSPPVLNCVGGTDGDELGSTSSTEPRSADKSCATDRSRKIKPVKRESGKAAKSKKTASISSIDANAVEPAASTTGDATNSETSVADPSVVPDTAAKAEPVKRGRKKSKPEVVDNESSAPKPVEKKRSKSTSRGAAAKKAAAESEQPSSFDLEERCHYEWVDTPPPPAPKPDWLRNWVKEKEQQSKASNTSSNANSSNSSTVTNNSENSPNASNTSNTNNTNLSNSSALTNNSENSPKTDNCAKSVVTPEIVSNRQSTKNVTNSVDVTMDENIDSCSVSEATVLKTQPLESGFMTAIPRLMVDSSILTFPLFTVGSPRTTTDDANIRFPSVSAILRTTMSDESRVVLLRWEEKMIEQLGEDGFRQYKETLFANGANLHLNIQQYLSGKPDEEITILPANEGHWHSMEPIFSCLSDVVGLEKPVRHSQLQYCGVLDCVAEYKGHYHVIEWKTSKRRKSNIKYTFDNPLQLVAYLGAFNQQPVTQLQVERCMLVIGYEDGSAADVHIMDKWDCLNYWSSWLHRLHQFKTTSSSQVASDKRFINQADVNTEGRSPPVVAVNR